MDTLPGSSPETLASEKILHFDQMPQDRFFYALRRIRPAYIQGFFPDLAKACDEAENLFKANFELFHNVPTRKEAVSEQAFLSMVINRMKIYGNRDQVRDILRFIAALEARC